MTVADGIHREARISECGLYRYSLLREWSIIRPRLTIIMLNPSTADAHVDDPTIRRCVGFAKREGCGSLRVMNLFALRATEPAALKKASDPVGPENNALLDAVFYAASVHHSMLIAGWGTHGALRDRDREVVKMARDHGVRLQCFGHTAKGAPRHPLYLGKSAALENY